MNDLSIGWKKNWRCVCVCVDTRIHTFVFTDSISMAAVLMKQAKTIIDDDDGNYHFFLKYSSFLSSTIKSNEDNVITTMLHIEKMNVKIFCFIFPVCLLQKNEGKKIKTTKIIKWLNHQSIKKKWISLSHIINNSIKSVRKSAKMDKEFTCFLPALFNPFDYYYYQKIRLMVFKTISVWK